MRVGEGPVFPETSFSIALWLFEGLAPVATTSGSSSSDVGGVSCPAEDTVLKAGDGLAVEFVAVVAGEGRGLSREDWRVRRDMKNKSKPER